MSENDELITITLEFEDDEKVVVEPLFIFDVDGKDYVALAGKAKALMSEADLAFYQIMVPLLAEKESAVKAVTSFNEAEEIIYKRITPKKTREIEVKQYLKRKLVLDIKEQTANIMMQIIVTPTGSIKPGEVLKILQEQFGFPIDSFIKSRKRWYRSKCR